MDQFERQKLNLELRIESMKINIKLCGLITSRALLSEYRTIIEGNMRIALYDMDDALESPVKDRPEIIELVNTLKPLIKKVERLYRKKRSEF